MRIQLEKIQPKLDAVQTREVEIIVELEEVGTQLQLVLFADHLAAGIELEHLIREIEDDVVEPVQGVIELEEFVSEFDEIETKGVHVMLDQCVVRTAGRIIELQRIDREITEPRA